MGLANDFNDEFASPAQWVAMYRACGLQAVPSFRPREQPGQWKRPVIAWKEHENEFVPAATIEKWYGPGGEHASRSNMGLITGQCSGGVFCVDLDVKDGSQAMQWWAGLLAVHNNDIEPETVGQRTGGGGRQILFRAPPGWAPPTFKTPIGIDVRGQGGFMVAPPSLHESGVTYDWMPGRGPWECDILDAPEWLIEAVDKLREEHGGAPTGSRERTPSEHAKNAFGLDIDDREEKLRNMVWAAVVDLYRTSPIPPSQAEQEAEKGRLWKQYLTTTASRLSRPGADKGDLLEAEGRGWSELNRKWRYAMQKWEKEVRVAAATERPHTAPPPEPAAEPEQARQDALTLAFDPWERFVVPAFPMDALPPILRRYADHQAQIIGADRSGVAAAALVACSAAISHDFRLKMMRTGDWHVRPRLWSVLVGDPSDKKTPIINSVIEPLDDLDIEASRTYARQHAAWADAYEAKQASKRDEPPRPARHVVRDVTAEKLSEILSRTDRGALVQRDELSGWVGSMEQYKGKAGAGSADRAHWIKAYDGGRYTVDRVKGETVLSNFSVSFLAGIQPDRLAELGNLTSDGLLQRFLPVMLAKPSLPVEIENEKPADEYRWLISYLASMPPCRLICENGAHTVISGFVAKIHEMEQSGAFSKAMTGFLGKLPGVLGSLMLVLHIVEDPQHATEMKVEQRTAEAAERLLMDFFVPHALEFYRNGDMKTDGDTLRSVTSYLLTSGLTRFRPKELTAHVGALRAAGLWQIQRTIAPLIAGGWLRPEDDTPTCKAWILEDGVLEAFAKRIEIEKARRLMANRFLNKFQKGPGNE